jgi:DNA-binding MarR family transcriptional regulator
MQSFSIAKYLKLSTIYNMKYNVVMQADNTQLCLAVLQVWGKIKTNIAALAEAHDLTMQQIFTLYSLYSSGGILMGELAKQMHCDASNVTGIIDRLEQHRLAERRALPSDRRAKQLCITQEGKDLIERILPRLPENVGFEALSPEEHKTLYHLLTKVH